MRPTLSDIEYRAIRNRDAERMSRRNRAAERLSRRDLYAGLYGLHLRQRGFSAADAAALVIERYPHTRPLLEPLVAKWHRQEDEERVWMAKA